MVDALQALQSQQPSEEELVQTVAQVVQPVVATTPDPGAVAMDMTALLGARPESTMGTGQPVTSPDMPLVFEDDDEQQQRDEEKRHKEEEAKWAAQNHGWFRHPTDAMDEEDFDDAVEK